MAPGKPAVDFNAMINADRQRRKNEALANEIFAQGRRSSAPGAGMNNRKPGAGPSLASRIGPAGVAKRTISTSTKPARVVVRPTAGNVDAEWTHDLHALNNPSAAKASPLPRGPRASHLNRGDRLHSALNGSSSSPALNSQFNIVGVSKASAGISIRGLAGPYCVVAKNLAPGTTDADIEAAMTPVGGTVLSCIIIAKSPKVIAELVFETKEGADNVVDTFNNKNADGNVLHVYHKIGPMSSAHKLPNISNTPKTPSAPVASAPRPATPLGPRADIDRHSDTRSSGHGGFERYVPRERSRERRRDDQRDEVMDGTYGFDERMDTDDRDDNRFEKGRGRGLYSDSMVGNHDRGHGNTWDRGRTYDRARGNR